MGGSVEGARIAEQTMISEMGEENYRAWRKEIGRKGRLAGVASGGSKRGGFAADPELAKEAGRIGGRVSKRRKMT